MNSITSTKKFIPYHSLSQEEMKKVLSELSSLYGIKRLNVDKDEVDVEFYHMSLSPYLVKDALVKAGFPFKTQNEETNFFSRFLSKLAKDNKETFGGKTPGCCGH